MSELSALDTDEEVTGNRECLYSKGLNSQHIWILNDPSVFGLSSRPFKIQDF